MVITKERCMGWIYAKRLFLASLTLPENRLLELAVIGRSHRMDNPLLQLQTVCK
jgi:hypothetical protein